MSKFLPFMGKKETLPATTSPATIEGDVVVVQGKTTQLSTAKFGGIQVQVKSKMVSINGVKQTLDPYHLMRMIKRVTQQVGEYKDNSSPYALYIITALRKARGDMINDLEHHFGITWIIDDQGQSVFSMR